MEGVMFSNRWVGLKSPLPGEERNNGTPNTKQNVTRNT